MAHANAGDARPVGGRHQSPRVAAIDELDPGQRAHPGTYDCFDQRACRTDDLQPRVVGPHHPAGDVEADLGHVDDVGTMGAQVIDDARQKPHQLLQSRGEQDVTVAALRDTGAGHAVRRQRVALDDGDVLDASGQGRGHGQSGQTGTDHDRAGAHAWRGPATVSAGRRRRGR